MLIGGIFRTVEAKSSRRVIYCKKCGSYDVWRWGLETGFIHELARLFNMRQLTCRKCGRSWHVQMAGRQLVESLPGEHERLNRARLPYEQGKTKVTPLPRLRHEPVRARQRSRGRKVRILVRVPSNTFAARILSLFGQRRVPATSTFV